MSWAVLDTGAQSAKLNMKLDTDLLGDLSSRSDPIIHWYEWEGDCATYGHFIKVDQLLQTDSAKGINLNLARRPTGGGIIFHLWDFAFSVLIPASHPLYSQNTLENYRLINGAVQRAVEKWIGVHGRLTLLPEEPKASSAAAQHFCMAKPTRYDILIGERKVGGAAQRKTKAGLLHQGSLFLLPPDLDYVAKIIQPGSDVLDSIRSSSGWLLPANASQQERYTTSLDLRELIHESLSSLY